MRKGFIFGIIAIFTIVLMVGLVSPLSAIGSQVNKAKASSLTARGCVDSDAGENALVKGTTSYSGNTKTDYCTNTKTLMEYSCKSTGKGYNVYGQKITCLNRCKNGACSVDATKKIMRKSAAGLTYGDVNLDGSFNLADINLFVDIILLRRAPPAAGSNEFVAIDVNGDGILDLRDLNLYVDMLLGRISKFPIDNLEVCTDSDDGLDYFVNGSVSEQTYGGTFADKCADYTYSPYVSGECSGANCFVLEYSCNSLLKNMSTSLVPCNYGCKKGACLSMQAKPTGEIPFCIDSDGGRDYFNAGEMIITYQNGTTFEMPRGGEYCYGGTADYNIGYKTSCSNTEYCYIMEYGCEDIRGPLAQYSCSNGCSNGACLV